VASGILMKAVSNFSSNAAVFRPISPFAEMGAYEQLSLQKGASFKTIADRFRGDSEVRLSDFVPSNEAEEAAERALELLTSKGVDVGVSLHGTADYPTRLRAAAHPLELLYYTGAWDLVHSRSVAVVGTREPTPEGRQRARQIVRHLIEDDYTVISGLARGIDTVVHTTAIELKGRTVAVIGTPLGFAYPPENGPLQHRIAREYLLISQVPVLRYTSVNNPAANRFFFVERNITLSALSYATIIIEASETSGTLTEARHALKQGRKLFILDSNFTNPTLTWPAKFERLGAIRVKSYADIHTHLAYASTESQPTADIAATSRASRCHG